MLRQMFVGFLASVLWAGFASAQTCAAYPYNLTNGTTADATQVMENFNSILSCGNNSLAPLAGPRFTGNVGIGASTPTTPLDLGSGITTIKLALYEDGTPQNTYGIGVNSGELSFGAAITPTGTPQMVLTSAGYLGVGATAPSYRLYVNGTAYASGAAGALSDLRHKDKVKTFPPGALAIVEQLRPVTFVWKDPRDDGMRGEQIGFIAQEMQKTLPSVVLTEKNAEKTLGIKYTQIIPVLAAAVQEQQAEIVELKAEAAALKQR